MISLQWDLVRTRSSVYAETRDSWESLKRTRRPRCLGVFDNKKKNIYLKSIRYWNRVLTVSSKDFFDDSNDLVSIKRSFFWRPDVRRTGYSKCGVVEWSGWSRKKKWMDAIKSDTVKTVGGGGYSNGVAESEVLGEEEKNGFLSSIWKFANFGETCSFPPRETRAPSTNVFKLEKQNPKSHVKRVDRVLRNRF